MGISLALLLGTTVEDSEMERKDRNVRMGYSGIQLLTPVRNIWNAAKRSAQALRVRHLYLPTYSCATVWMRSVYRGKSNAPIKAISQHVRWRIGGWRNLKKSRLEK